MHTEVFAAVVKSCIIPSPIGNKLQTCRVGRHYLGLDSDSRTLAAPFLSKYVNIAKYFMTKFEPFEELSVRMHFIATLASNINGNWQRQRRAGSCNEEVKTLFYSK